MTEPPGLPAIRRFFDRPWLRGVGAWLRYLGRGIRRGWRFFDRNAGPIARGLAAAGRTAENVSRGAVRVGRAAIRIGDRLGPDRGGPRLRRIGEGVTRAGSEAEGFAGEVADLGTSLASLAGGKPESASLPKPLPGKLPPEADLPQAIRERIRALGKRRRKKPLRALILEICAMREWTTVGELADWFRMDTSNLQRRHLRPMLKAGQLELRHPEQTSHPQQAYRTARS